MLNVYPLPLLPQLIALLGVRNVECLSVLLSQQNLNLNLYKDLTISVNFDKSSKLLHMNLSESPERVFKLTRFNLNL